MATAAAVPGAVRASAGINSSEQDVARLLSAVERLVAGEPPVRYRRDRSTADFYPAGPAAGPEDCTVPSEPTGFTAFAASTSAQGHRRAQIGISRPISMSRLYQPAGLGRGVPAVPVPAMISRPALS